MVRIRKAIGRSVRASRACALCAFTALALSLGGCSLLGGTGTSGTAGTEHIDLQIPAEYLVEEGVLTVAFDTTDAPQGITQDDGTVTGYNADVAAALAHQLGLKVRVVDASDAAEVLEGDQADLYFGAAPDDGDDALTSVGSYLDDAPAVFALTENADAVSASELSTWTVGVQASSAAQDALVKAGISASQQTYSNVNECFAALVGGEVDCVACDAAAGSYLARAFEGVEFVGTIDAVDEYDIVADADALELIDKVSEALGDIASNGTLDAVHAAWYGSVPRELANTLVDGVTLMVEEPRTESSLDDEGDEDELGTSEDGLTDESNEALADEPTDDLDADTLADDQEEDLDSESASSSTDTYQADDSEL